MNPFSGIHCRHYSVKLPTTAPVLTTAKFIFVKLSVHYCLFVSTSQEHLEGFVHRDHFPVHKHRYQGVLGDTQGFEPHLNYPVKQQRQ